MTAVGWLGPRGEHVDPVATEVLEGACGHPGRARIVDADDRHGRSALLGLVDTPPLLTSRNADLRAVSQAATVICTGAEGPLRA
jgi:hypothetical protein